MTTLRALDKETGRPSLVVLHGLGGLRSHRSLRAPRPCAWRRWPWLASAAVHAVAFAAALATFAPPARPTAPSLELHGLASNDPVLEDAPVDDLPLLARVDPPAPVPTPSEDALPEMDSVPVSEPDALEPEAGTEAPVHVNVLDVATLRRILSQSRSTAPPRARPAATDARPAGPPSPPATSPARPASARVGPRPVASNLAPVYPWAARVERREGVVRLRLRISATGLVESADVEWSSGHADLDAAAVAAVKSWTFVPASLDGLALAVEVTQDVRFVLER